MWSMLPVLLILSLIASSTATCYNRDRTVATGFEPCPGQKYCCKPTDTCATNGLCIDINNRLPDVVVTPLSDGSVVNGTYLYQTTTCTNADFSGCVTQCSTSSSTGAAYLWACNTGLTDFCCAAPFPLTTNQACCSTTGALFRLQPAIALPWNSTVSPAATTTTSQSSQSASASSSTSSARSSSSAPASVSSTPAATSVASNVANAVASSTSQGTQIGIGVGVTVGVLLLIIVVVLLWRRRAQRKRTAEQRSHGEVQQHLHGHEAAPEYHDHVVGIPAAEKSGVTADEMLAPVEADSTVHVHELSGHRRAELP